MPRDGPFLIYDPYWYYHFFKKRVNLTGPFRQKQDNNYNNINIKVLKNTTKEDNYYTKQSNNMSKTTIILSPAEDSSEEDEEMQDHEEWEYDGDEDNEPKQLSQDSLLTSLGSTRSSKGKKKLGRPYGAKTKKKEEKEDHPRRTRPRYWMK